MGDSIFIVEEGSIKASSESESILIELPSDNSEALETLNRKLDAIMSALGVEEGETK